MATVFNSTQSTLERQVFSEFVSGNVTIIDRLRLHAESRPNVTAYTFLRDEGDTDSLTFEQLEKRAIHLAHNLSKHTRVGDRALLLYPSGLDFITAFLACLYAGIIAVPATTPRKNRSMQRLQAIFEDSTPRLILTTSDIIPLFAKSSWQPSDVTFIATDALMETPAAACAALPATGPQTIAFLQYTSGSTGKPKGVIVSHENLASNALTLKEGLGLSEKSVNVGWLPLFHDMGLIGNILTSLYVGFPCVLMSPGSFLQKPVLWLRAITKYRGTMVGGPNFGWDYCARVITEEEKEGLDLSSIVTAYNGSEPVRASTLQNFHDAFRDYGFRLETFFPCYGLAEATLFVSGGPEGRLPNVLEVDSDALERNRVSISPWKDGQASEIVGCGRAWGDTRVEIVDPETGVPCLPGEIGEIWLSGGSVAKGYWQRPIETSESFHAYIADTDEGPFLRTGDLGFVREGELFITGRLKDLIIIRGRNIYPHDVESTVERIVDFVKPNTCAAFSIETDGQEALALVIEADRKLVRVVQRWNKDRESLDANMIFYTGGAQIREVERLVSRIRQAVTEEYEVPLHSITFVMPGTFPRTTSGKVQRSVCRSKLLNAELEVVFSSDSTLGIAPQYGSDKTGIKSVADLRALIRDRVLRVLADELKIKVDYVDFDAPLTSLGLDSLGMVTLALDLEEKTVRP
jgi:acyl-CoA synthetase (AMP-forming)/AMP-acid ligase II